MSEEFETSEGREPIEQAEDSREMGALDQMTEEPGAYLEQTGEIMEAELVEAAFTEVVAVELDVLPFIEPAAEEEVKEGESLPTPNLEQPSEGVEMDPDPVDREISQEMAIEQEDPAAITDNLNVQEEVELPTSPDGLPVPIPLPLDEGAEDPYAEYDREILEVQTDDHTLKLQIFMDRKDKNVVTLSQLTEVTSTTADQVIQNIR